jgi:hypothetical protein
VAGVKRKAPRLRTLKQLRADAPPQDRDLPALALPPAPMREPPTYEPLDTIPLAIAYDALALIAVDFEADAGAVADLLLWNSVSRWWAQTYHKWGHPEASMLSAEAGYRLQGQPSRFPDLLPDDTERAAYLHKAALARAEWDALDCPGLLDDLEPTLTWVRQTIQKRETTA